MRIARLLINAAIVATMGMSPISPEAGAQSSAERRLRIAVMDFDYGTVMSSSSAYFGTNVDLGKGISSLLVTDLVKDGTYSVIERAALDKVLAEQNFSNSSRADAISAARIGKILGVDYIVVGTITEFGAEAKKQNVGGGGVNLHGFGLGNIGHSDSKAEVAIDARIINTDTAEILAAAEGKGQSSRSGLSLGGGGGNGKGNGTGNVDLSSSNFQNSIIGEATRKAVTALAADLAGQAGRLTVRALKIDALVAAVDGGQVILNAGARAGIHPGDQLSVVRVGREIKDPATGQVIRRLTSTIGTIQAADVDDASSVCNPVSGSGFQVGDHAVTPGTSPGATSPMVPSPAAASPGPQSSAPGAAPSTDTAQLPAAAGDGGQPNFTAIKADFVPGEKTILFDDFSDMQGDEPPPHWKVRGGVAELRVAGQQRQLAIVGKEVHLTPNVATVPRNFTLDYDVTFSENSDVMVWHFSEKTGRRVLYLATRRVYNQLSIDSRGPVNSTIYSGMLDKVDFTKAHHIAYWVQEGRMRMYFDGARIFDVNQIQFTDLSAPDLEVDVSNDPGAHLIGIGAARLAESSPDFGKTILSSGKFVTHGILFDTDSDRVKPESAAVIQMIAKALASASDMNVEIDGHTDSTGNAAHNQDLSKRRADAVKNILVSQFGIDAGRLTTAGFGSSKPIDSNNTPEGKANNRRVEFVRK